MRISVLCLIFVFVAITRSSGYDVGDDLVVIKDTAASFYDKVDHTLKAGEKIVVFKHDRTSGKIFFLSTNAVGKRVALSVPDSAVDFTEEHRAAEKSARFSQLQKETLVDIDSKKIQIQLKVTQGTKDGSIGDVSTPTKVPVGTVEIPTYYDPLANMGNGVQYYREDTTYETQYKHMDGQMFVYGLTSVGEGQKWEGAVYPAGMYHYVSPGGTPHRIARYTLSAAKALELTLIDEGKDMQ